MARAGSKAGGEQVAVPSKRRQEMRAQARTIIEMSAHRRKNGATDDLAGRITTAMAQAYRQGVRDAELIRAGRFPQADPAAPVDLHLMSRRAFFAFIGIGALVFGGPFHGPLCDDPKGYLHWLAADPPTTREERWRLSAWQMPAEPQWDVRRLESRKSVGPWAAHGLIERQKGTPHFRFTRLAFISWRAYLQQHPDHGNWGRRLFDTSGYVRP